MVLVNSLKSYYMAEGIIETMFLFIGLRALLSRKSKDKDMSKNKRGKRANKYKETAAELELNSYVRKSERQRLREEKAKEHEKPKKPFEEIKLLPAREAQRKPDNV